VAFNFTGTSEAALLRVKELLLIRPRVAGGSYVAQPPEQRA
jgi:hypothetical protein